MWKLPLLMVGAELLNPAKFRISYFSCYRLKISFFEYHSTGHIAADVLIFFQKEIIRKFLIFIFKNAEQMRIENIGQNPGNE